MLPSLLWLLTLGRATPALQAEFRGDTEDLCLDGSEYYVRHLRFKRTAQRLLGSYQDCVTVEER